MPQNLNVGLGIDYTIDEYYHTIAKVLGFKCRFTYDLSKPAGMKQKCVDITQLQSLGWSAQTSLESGISQTYKYYLEKGQS